MMKGQIEIALYEDSDTIYSQGKYVPAYFNGNYFVRNINSETRFKKAYTFSGNIEFLALQFGENF